MFENKKALLLDMNSTFMFGEDNFGKDEDFSIYYKKIGGQLSSNRHLAKLKKKPPYLYQN